MKSKTKLIIYGSLVTVILLSVILLVAFSKKKPEEPVEDTTADITEPEEEPADAGALEIVMDTLNVPQNTLSLPSMQLLPILKEWGELTWESEDPTIAEATEGGLIYSKSPGETTLTGTSADGLLTAHMAVFVEETEEETEVPEGLRLEITDFRTGQALLDAFFAYYEGSPDFGEEIADESMEEEADMDGGTVTLAERSTSLTWESTSPEIADVSETGIISFLDSGVAAVSAEDENGSEWLYLEMNLFYGEEIPLEGLEAEADTLDIAVGETMTPEITYKPENTTNKVLNWTSDDPSVASVTNTGQITGEKEGTCRITAVSPKNSGISLEWNVTVKFVELEGLSASVQNLTVGIGASVTANLTYTPANSSEKEVNWSSSNEGIARVDSNGKVTGVKEGDTTITATSKNKSALKASFNVKVTKDTTINTEGNQVIVYKGSQTVVLYKNGEQVRSMICSTGKSGADTPNGEYTVPAKYGSWYYFRTVGCWIQYGVGIRGNYLFHSVPYYPPSGTSQSDYNGYMSISGYNNLGSRASAGCIRMCARDIKWLYNNVSVGTKITITNASGPGADYGLPKTSLANGKSYHWDPTDPNPNNPYNVSIDSISISDSSAALTEGDSKNLSASWSPNSAAVSISWSSSDNGVVSVDDNGRITAVRAGNATITVRDDFSGKTASCSVTVKAKNIAVSGIKLNTTSKTLTKKGDSFSLSVTVSPDNASNKGVSWSSSDKSVATVDNGKVTAVANGTATITAKTKDGGKTATCKVTVSIPVSVTGVSLNAKETTLEIGGTFTLTATVAPNNASNKGVSWSSSDKNVATVDNGKVTAHNAGTAVITVTTADGGKTASCTITVNTAPEPPDPEPETASRLLFDIPARFSWFV